MPTRQARGLQRPKPGMVVKFLVKLLKCISRDVFSFYKFSAGKRLHPHANTHTFSLSHTHTCTHTHTLTHTCTHRSRRSSDITFKKMFWNERVNVHKHTHTRLIRAFCVLLLRPNCIRTSDGEAANMHFLLALAF